MTSSATILKATTRKETGKKVGKLRKQEKIPAVLYGHKIKPINLSVDYPVFQKVLTQAGESTLVDLVIDDSKPVKILIQDYQLDPVNNRIMHVDFHQIKMDEKLHTKIELKFINEAPAVKELSGTLVTNIDSLDVECLPQYLVHEIEVDLSILKTFDNSIHVADIKIPEGITVLNIPNDVIALVQEPRSEKELTDLESKPEKTELPAVEGKEETAEKTEE
ncbi:MAG: 50S ribosomal protein L25 [Patescibacteria group bacterium]|jgi:large subunit ribosomal protein L25